jgi:hypothetical protein
MKKHSLRAIFALLLITTIPAISWVSATHSHLKFFNSTSEHSAKKSKPVTSSNNSSNELFVQHVNAVYEQKYKISQVLEKFCNLNNLEPSFKIVSESSNKYTGSGILLKSLDINLDGLENGLLTYKEKYGCI